MYKVMIVLYFLSAHLSYSSELTKEDLQEIIEIKNRYSDCQDKDYLETFKEAWDIERDQLQRFRLKSGVDVAIPLNILRNLQDSFHPEETLGNSFGLILQENLQECFFPEEFMKNKNPEVKILLGKKYGKICNEKFKNYIIAVKLALLCPDKVAYIDNNQFKISINQAHLTHENSLRSLSLAPNANGFDDLSSFKLNFRYFSPVNEGNSYGLFFCTENRYMNDLGQEELIGSFSVDQVLKQF